MSGHPTEDTGALVNDGGNLVSTPNYANDTPDQTLPIGFVERPSNYQTNRDYWNALLLADSRYSDKLTYCLFPEKMEALLRTACTGHNSNSYAIGLVQSRGGLAVTLIAPLGITMPIANATIFPGSTLPVPASEF